MYYSRISLILVIYLRNIQSDVQLKIEIQPTSKAMGFHSLQKTWGKVLHGQKRPYTTKSQQKMPSKLPKKDDTKVKHKQHVNWLEIRLQRKLTRLL